MDNFDKEIAHWLKGIAGGLRDINKSLNQIAEEMSVMNERNYEHADRERIQD